MTKPTREEVNDMREVAVLAGDADIVALVDAYIEQEEDMEKISPYVVGLVMEIADLKAQNQALKDKFDWFKNEREKDSRVIDRLLEEKQKLEAYIAENEGYQP